MRLGPVAFGGLTAVLLFLPQRAEAQPTCAAGTLASYAALGADGCTYGGLTFRDVSASAWRFVGTPTTSITDAVQVTPFTRMVGGMSYVGFAVTPTAGFATSSAEALTGGDYCNDRCYQAGSNLTLRLRVEGDAFTGAFGLGARTARTLAATGTDWWVNYYEQLVGISPPSVTSTVRQASAGQHDQPESCVVAATQFESVPCDGPAIIAHASPFASFEGYLGLIAITGFDPRSADGPHGEGSVAVAGTEFLFGVNAASSTVPEPTTLTLGALGLALVGGWRLRRRRHEA